MIVEVDISLFGRGFESRHLHHPPKMGSSLQKHLRFTVVFFPAVTHFGSPSPKNTLCFSFFWVPFLPVEPPF